MRKRRLLLGLALAAGPLLYRRRGARRRERVDLYYEDGSTVSHAAGSPEAERLLALARDVLDAARS
ncbi:MAG TPA: hypothetical protein VFL66_05680 [Gaiellaceae bacterium]|nr:hypothetical protein [Gaiellaceae bacterium]